VPQEGLEPPLRCRKQILSLPRLPFRHWGRHPDPRALARALHVGKGLAFVRRLWLHGGMWRHPSFLLPLLMFLGSAGPLGFASVSQYAFPYLTHGRKFRLAMQRNLAAVVRFVVGIGLIVHRALMAGSMLVCKCRQGLWPIYRWKLVQFFAKLRQWAIQSKVSHISTT